MPTPRRKPIADAPRDGTCLILWGSREPREFVGMYSRRFRGWVGLHEIICPMLRHDITHWAPADDDLVLAALHQSRPPRRRRITVIGFPRDGAA